MHETFSSPVYGGGGLQSSRKRAKEDGGGMISDSAPAHVTNKPTAAAAITSVAIQPTALNTGGSVKRFITR
jgi:hypothetical protein